ncbi:MAG: hypothetical protein Q9169_004806 [Polycauliona sp. 2 TL-2023]
MVCSACKGAPKGVHSDPNDLTAIYYCSAICQRGSWSSHKSECKSSQQRRAVYRAATVIQKLSFIYRRQTWSWPISKVERRNVDGIGDVWQIYDAEPPGSEAGYFLPFPEDLFPRVQDQEAILSESNCRNALADMDILINDLLKVMKHQKHLPMEPSCNRQHDILRLALKIKEVYALDITGAQYWWPASPIVPWDHFMSEKVEHIKAVCKSGKAAKDLRDEASAASDRSSQNHHQIMGEMRQCFYIFLQRWQDQQGIKGLSLKDMLMLPEEKYKLKQESLLQFMDKEMTALLLEVDKAATASTTAAIKQPWGYKDASQNT